MARVYNFSAGPAVLPEEVLKEAAAEMLDYKGSGQSVMEMSHRSKAFEEIINSAEQDLRDLMNIPDNYKVLFMQGGASQQFAMIPMNFMKNRVADYIITGSFSKKAAQEAKKFGAKTIGVGMNMTEAARPLILDEAGGIGLFAVGYQRGCKPAGEDKGGCLSWSEMEIIRSTIQEIKTKCRWCVVVAHGGEEFTAIPSPYTRDRYHAYLEMGADLVVCHHPHVPMNYETVGDKMIFYSLGNFIFDTDYQRAQFNTEKGILLKLHFTEDSYSFEAFGLKINRENEHIESAPLPRIFADIQENDYNKLEPLAAKMFLAATKRQQLFLYPDKFKDATEEQWKAHFYEEKRSGRVPGEALDFQIIYPIAQEEAKGAWKTCKLEDVKAYILEQM